MTRCNRPGCGRGTLDADGYCPACGRKALPPARAAGASTGVAQVRPDPWYGLALVDDTRLPDGPGAAPAREPRPESGPVAEEHRYCHNPGCGRPVGRSVDGSPGRIFGFCARCGTRFDFTHVAGLLIAGRYEVRRLLGQGSYGVAYLAYDRNLKTDVVLKELRTALAASDRERDVLVGLRHDAIVRILGYEEEHDRTYLVLEYLPGQALQAAPGDRLATFLAHGLRLLQALDYLHARGLLHCDVKPLNIIRFAETAPSGALDRVRLIDFGAVRSVTDTAPLSEYTERYAPPPGDAEYTDGPTPGFDLYGLGMTLAETSHELTKESSAPGVQSLRLLLDRSVHSGGPRQRFTSARQFGEQLSGVVRQVVAAPETGRRVTRASALFGPMPEALHGGIGAPRPLGDWVRATVERPAPDGPVRLTLPPLFRAPGPWEVAAALPMPVHDPDDTDVTTTVQGELDVCRKLLRAGEPADAAAVLDRVPLPADHWLTHWYRGLIALRDDELARSTSHFTQVRAALPGELVPQLVLGLCAERSGDAALATTHYSTVLTTSPALGAAGFGLARITHRADGPAAAAGIVEGLAQEFRFAREAHIAGFRLSLERPEAAVPRIPAGLGLVEAERASLAAESAYAEYLRTEDRLALSDAIRGLARHCPNERDFYALVDLANELRPDRKWPWYAGTRPRTHAKGNNERHFRSAT
ncbi:MULTISPECIES: tetratricopeptide repeat protein [unclassified Streptomyces]|uniref:tetratricopeptide repeat protein n=1 Tax=unclassified Streptomyces TaxID=2593676 RepID=UPI000DB9821B|nr:MULTISPECIES: tetratricopeptide repeat protein [unclassified Streptomyces]MYT75097.1 protein kinase [Streptomyces sp. SID8367]RAJ77054.1 serine/threonine-protein kinase PknG [Streptomyces sp. PsTaAH-137]